MNGNMEAACQLYFKEDTRCKNIIKMLLVGFSVGKRSLTNFSQTNMPIPKPMAMNIGPLLLLLRGGKGTMRK